MNFIKIECQEIRNINHIVAEDLQHQLRQALYLKGYINRELELDLSNNSANLIVGENKYPNTTYAFRASSLKEIVEGFNLFMVDFLDKLKDIKHVSFRKTVTIEQENGYYDLYLRAAIVT